MLRPRRRRRLSNQRGGSIHGYLLGPDNNLDSLVVTSAPCPFVMLIRGSQQPPAQLCVCLRQPCQVGPMNYSAHLEGPSERIYSVIIVAQWCVVPGSGNVCVDRSMIGR